MKFKVAISIEDGPLPYWLHVAVPEMNGFKAAKFKFKRLEDAEKLHHEYLDEFIHARNQILRFHLRKIRELHGEEYIRKD